MEEKESVSRRRFVGKVATALGALGLRPDPEAFAQAAPAVLRRPNPTVEEYDALVKLSSNENNYGPPKAVMDAMTGAWKYANRYGYPDGRILQAIADHHGVKPENVLLGAGSGEILDVVGTTFLMGGKKVVGVEPSYGSVYQHVTAIKAEAIKIPLNPDYSQNMDGLIEATNKNAASVGFVYLCNPNNPTGRIVSAKEVKQLLDGIPKTTPVLIDEAYHHFVEDPSYATSVPYVLEGRPVIIARTFSKIAALAAMRLGYAVAPASMIQQMRPYAMSSVNALVKWGGVASLKDTAGQAEVKEKIIALRKKTTKALEAWGYPVIPSEANFFMVSLAGREVVPVIEEFRLKGIAVGRPFPPMTQHLRVSVGLPAEMDLFLTAFKELFPQRKA